MHRQKQHDKLEHLVDVVPKVLDGWLGTLLGSINVTLHALLQFSLQLQPQHNMLGG